MHSIPRVLKTAPSLVKPLNRIVQSSIPSVHAFTSAASQTSAAASSAGQSTVNPEEISHFSRLSSMWWDEHGEFSQLHRMNPVRMQFIREKLIETALEDDLNASIPQPRILDGLRVLDVGCGGGLLSEALTRLGADTTGIDASSSNIQIASLHAAADSGLPFVDNPSFGSSGKGKARLSYNCTTVEDLLAERGPGAFDIVCSMEVLEHVNNPRAFLDSCAQLVKPGGHLFLSTISRTPLAYFLTIFTAEKVLDLAAPGTHTYNKFILPEELEGFFREYCSPSGTRSWITSPGSPRRTEAEVRGMVYLPWTGWSLGPRFSKWAELSNYLFWVRRPTE